MPLQPRTILVTDGEQRASLAAVRALGAAGHVVYVSSHTRRSLAGGSRYSAGEIRTASPLRETDRFVADVQNFVRSHAIDTILPMTEPALLALLPVRSRFPGVLIPFASAEAFERISDKQTVLDAATRVGIAIPAQTVVTDAEAAAALDPAALCYPLVAKPARSVAGAATAREKFGVTHVASPDALRSYLARVDSRAFPVLLQQRVLGPGVGVFLLLWGGACVAQFSHRRIREKPPSGGVSVYRESITLDPSLAERSRALLDQFDWEGVAMIEYKVDSATGTPYLMEINGRFWGSLQLAVDAGVDFPRLLIEAATGEQPAPVTQYRVGVRSRWFWGDVDHLIARLRSGAAALALPPDAPTRWQTLRAFFHRSPGDVNEILRADDPRPFIRQTREWFRNLRSS